MKTTYWIERTVVPKLREVPNSPLPEEYGSKVIWLIMYREGGGYEDAYEVYSTRREAKAVLAKIEARQQAEA